MLATFSSLFWVKLNGFIIVSTTSIAFGLMCHTTMLMDKDERDQSRSNYMPKQILRIQNPRRCTENHATARYYGRNVIQRARKQGTLLELVSSRGTRSSKRRYTLSVKMSDFTVWSHTWQKNRVNCAVLTGNSAGLRTVLSSRLSHTELRSSLRESHTHSGQFLVQIFLHS